MRISDTEVKKILSQGNDLGDHPIVDAIVEIGKEADRKVDEAIVKKVTQDVMAMPDREAMISDLRERIKAGTYNPSGDEIADTMIRRAIADRIR